MDATLLTLGKTGHLWQNMNSVWGGPGPSPFHKRAAATAEEEAYGYILTRIRRGEYHPGDRLKAEEVATAIGMSRMPVREAFRRLAAEGLLSMRPNRGAVVAVLTRDDIQEIFEIRAVLEGLAIRLATPNVDDEALSNLSVLLDWMQRAMNAANLEEWLTRHRQFHEYLCSLSQRPRLLHQISGLHTAVEPYVRMWFVHIQRPLSVRSEHEEVIAAIRSSDADRAEAVMKNHILATAPELAPHLTEASKHFTNAAL